MSDEYKGMKLEEMKDFVEVTFWIFLWFLLIIMTVQWESFFL